uniref:Putative secreted protein n=1 Tax=Anopheles triannulatus TaxID=58253 RepID=A0A2M4B2X4_9DIPT
MLSIFTLFTTATIGVGEMLRISVRPAVAEITTACSSEDFLKPHHTLQTITSDQPDLTKCCLPSTSIITLLSHSLFTLGLSLLLLLLQQSSSVKSFTAFSCCLRSSNFTTSAVRTAWLLLISTFVAFSGDAMQFATVKGCLLLTSEISSRSSVTLRFTVIDCFGCAASSTTTSFCSMALDAAS